MFSHTAKSNNWFVRVGQELGIRVFVDFKVNLPDGEEVRSNALFPDFGGSNGTLVFHRWPNKSIRHQLAALGFGVSTFGTPNLKEDTDFEGCKEMFNDWTWTGNSQSKPDWIETVDGE